MEVKFICELFIDPCDQIISLYDLETEKVLWEGYAQDLPYEFEDWNVCSIDNLTSDGKIVLNVDSADEEIPLF